MTKKKPLQYCVLQIGDNNQRLLICSCGLIVDCADPDHNSPGGCRNPDCWKHPKPRNKACTSAKKPKSP
jgi:hypothetical protein